MRVFVGEGHRQAPTRAATLPDRWRPAPGGAVTLLPASAGRFKTGDGNCRKSPVLPFWRVGIFQPALSDNLSYIVRFFGMIETQEYEFDHLVIYQIERWFFYKQVWLINLARRQLKCSSNNFPVGTGWCRLAYRIYRSVPAGTGRPAGYRRPVPAGEIQQSIAGALGSRKMLLVSDFWKINLIRGNERVANKRGAYERGVYDRPATVILGASMDRPVLN